jgi:hypothetical protein
MVRDREKPISDCSQRTSHCKKSSHSAGTVKCQPSASSIVTGSSLVGSKVRRDIVDEKRAWRRSPRKRASSSFTSTTTDSDRSATGTSFCICAASWAWASRSPAVCCSVARCWSQRVCSASFWSLTFSEMVRWTFKDRLWMA